MDRIRIHRRGKSWPVTAPFGDDLHNVIVAHQKTRGGTQDFIVSPARENTATPGMYDRNHNWIILALNSNIMDFYPDIYPRLDQIKDVPIGGEIVKTIRASMTKG